MGETAEKIKNAVVRELEIEKKELNIIRVKNVEEAVLEAKAQAKNGEVVLFSPASTSFDMFKDMYDRGNQFKDMVMKF